MQHISLHTLMRAMVVLRLHQRSSFSDTESVIAQTEDIVQIGKKPKHRHVIKHYLSAAELPSSRTGPGDSSITPHASLKQITRCASS